jgi:hypothetical protein
MNLFLLDLGRTVGSAKWTQLRQFVKAGKAVEAGTAKEAIANLQFNAVERDAFQRALNNFPLGGDVAAKCDKLNRQTFPELYKPDVITKIKLLFKHGVDNSRMFSINQVVEDSEGVLIKGKGKILATDKNVSAKFASNSKKMAMKGGYEFNVADGGGIGVKTSCVSKGDNYNCKLDAGNLINNANLNLKAPKEYLDGIAEIMGCKSFEELWTSIPEKVKNLI